MTLREVCWNNTNFTTILLLWEGGGRGGVGSEGGGKGEEGVRRKRRDGYKGEGSEEVRG